jgi:hypothetical protein
MSGPNKRRVVPLVIALVVAGVFFELLICGNYCLLPSQHLQPWEKEYTAEMSIYGIPLYRRAGPDNKAMYDEVYWWYETTLLAEWGVAVVIGVGVYLVVRWWRERGRSSFAGPPQTPQHGLQQAGGGVTASPNV